MINYKWAVSQMDCYPQSEGQTDVVFNVHWICTGTQDDYSSSAYSTCSVKFNTEDSYTPFDQLTEEQVLGWIWNSGINKEATENSIAQNIEALINPPVVSPPLPWSNINE